MRRYSAWIELKTQIDDLAIFGGLPEFRDPVHVGRPNTGNRETFVARVNEVLDSSYLTNNGPKVPELEERLAEFLKVKHVVAVCNGTLALELLIRAMGLEGEVILSPGKPGKKEPSRSGNRSPRYSPNRRASLHMLLLQCFQSLTRQVQEPTAHPPGLNRRIRSSSRIL